MNNKALGLIGIATKAGKVSFGTDAVLERILKKKTSLVIIAKDASNKAKENMNYVCKKNEIKIIGNASGPRVLCLALNIKLC